MANDEAAFDPSVGVLLDMIQGHRLTRTIQTAVRLGIADLLADGAKTSIELAQQSGAHEPSLRRLLRALITLGICTQGAGGRFELTAMGAHLAAGASNSLRGWALFEGERLSQVWGGLLDTIRTGKNAAGLAGMDNHFELMARDPEAVKVFNEAMVSFTRLVAPAVAAAYDFSGVHQLIDIGGGYGELLGAILKANPTMRGAVYDLERCAEGAKQQLTEAGVADRAEFIPGNFFESVPSGADALILKSIIHDWDDDRCVTILRNCRRAMTPNNRLLLVERIMPERPQADMKDRFAALSDLNMLRGPGGSERTEREYRELLRKSGFEMARVLGAAVMNVIEGSPA